MIEYGLTLEMAKELCMVDLLRAIPYQVFSQESKAVKSIEQHFMVMR